MNCIKKAENLNLLWASLIVEELIRHNITYFCISPGSRSTPLTVAAARHPKVTSKIIYDERGAAFHILGYARATKGAAVLICTSGTAVANYYPAIVEAYQDNIPIIILSADRPPELRGRGANQTIDQVNIFGSFCRHFSDIPCPSIKQSPDFILKEVNTAVEKLQLPDSGPVQMNCMFREPLAPQKEAWPEEYLRGISDWLQSNKPFNSPKKKKTPDKSGQQPIINLINQSKKGIILAGRMEKTEDQQAVINLAEKTGWPVFADITSGLRLTHSSSKIIPFFDQLLLSAKIKNVLKNQPVLHFGGQLVSKRLLQFLEQHQADHIHVIETSKIFDPAHSVTRQIRYPVSRFIAEMLPEITEKPLAYPGLQAYNQKVHQCINDFLASHDTLNEISTAVIISRDIPDGTALFIASSMPVRDMDMFAFAGDKQIAVGANRGASGIDGTMASATGFANGIQKPLTLLIGDLAFLHDLNSLTMINACEQPVLIVLVNNQGGGIFSFLPIAQHQEIFERNFGTPHNYSFEKIAEMFDLKYFKPRSMKDFAKLYSQYQFSGKATLIEIRTDRLENVERHKMLQKQIQTQLQLPVHA